jgi:hypothetical protein
MRIGGDSAQEPRRARWCRHARGLTRAGEPRPRSPEIVPPSSGAGELSRGDSLFLLFFAATMIMVIAVVVVGAVGQTWVLVPVMLVDLTVTFALIATLVSMLGGDGGTPE